MRFQNMSAVLSQWFSLIWRKNFFMNFHPKFNSFSLLLHHLESIRGLNKWFWFVLGLVITWMGRHWKEELGGLRFKLCKDWRKLRQMTTKWMQRFTWSNKYGNSTHIQFLINNKLTFTSTWVKCQFPKSISN